MSDNIYIDSTMIVYNGKAGICDIIGFRTSDFETLLNEGLPAWNDPIDGNWRATHDELKEWLYERSKKYRNNNSKY